MGAGGPRSPARGGAVAGELLRRFSQQLEQRADVLLAAIGSGKGRGARRRRIAGERGTYTVTPAAAPGTIYTLAAKLRGRGLTLNQPMAMKVIARQRQLRLGVRPQRSRDTADYAAVFA